MNWQAPLVVATYRAVMGAVVLAGAAFFGALQGGATSRVAGIAAAVAFFGYLGTRGVVEGVVDQARA